MTNVGCVSRPWPSTTRCVSRALAEYDRVRAVAFADAFNWVAGDDQH